MYSPNAGQTVRCQVIRRATTMRRVQRARFHHEFAIFVHSSHSHHGGSCGTNCHPRPWYFYRYHFRLYFPALGYPFRAAPVSLRNDEYMYCRSHLLYLVWATCVSAFPKRFHPTRETTKQHNSVLPARSSPRISPGSA